MKKQLLSILTIVMVSNLFAQHTVTVKKGDDKNFTYFTIQGDTTKYSFKATVANYENRFEDAAKYTIKGIEKGEFKKPQNAYYDAACYYALTKKYNEASQCLLKSIENGWDDLGHLEHDPDLQELKTSQEWKENITPRLQAYYKYNNKELAKLFANDQNARLSGQINDDLAVQDSIRRQIVLKMESNKELKSGHDYYKAAMIMHHGHTINDYKRAEILIQKALNSKNVHHMAPWLSAAIKDRLLLKEGKPQWYGTQAMTFFNGKMALDPKTIDTTAVTPQKRIELNAPKIETLREYIKNFKANNK
ncbi:MAG: hypothetical protein KDC81_00440 [Flavobacteriaceae bacterium]|nr:hypothetical protein [Flavobacteriaceae bacterium]